MLKIFFKYNQTNIQQNRLWQSLAVHQNLFSFLSRLYFAASPGIQCQDSPWRNVSVEYCKFHIKIQSFKRVCFLHVPFPFHQPVPQCAISINHADDNTLWLCKNNKLAWVPESHTLTDLNLPSGVTWEINLYCAYTITYLDLFIREI